MAPEINPSRSIFLSAWLELCSLIAYALTGQVQSDPIKEDWPPHGGVNPHDRATVGSSKQSFRAGLGQGRAWFGIISY